MAEAGGALLCQELLGHCDDEQFAGRRLDPVPVAAADASKRRQRVTSGAGLDVAIDLPRGSFLRDGGVLADDGERIVVVARTPEDVMRVTIGPDLAAGARVAAALKVGHAFGNQHVPVEVVGEEVLVPITTSREIAQRTLDALALDGVTARFEQARLARERPLSGHAHGHEH
jgi:urease accessory protein